MIIEDFRVVESVATDGEGGAGAGIEEGGKSFLLATAGGLLLLELSLAILCPVREDVRTRGTPVLALMGVLAAAE